jgi:hypothetical protein
MKMKTRTIKTVITIAAFGWLTIAAHGGEMRQVALETFQIPEAVPNTTLDKTEGVSGTAGSLVRGNDFLRVEVSTKDLPEGAYTFWWHLTHPDKEVSILWAGNSLVSNTSDNVTLATELRAGEANAPGDIFIGHGLQPGTASDVSVQFWVRNHGPLSDNPAIAQEQLTKPFGGCTDERNPNPRASDYPCWNPQRAVF